MLPENVFDLVDRPCYEQKDAAEDWRKCESPGHEKDELVHLDWVHQQSRGGLVHTILDGLLEKKTVEADTDWTKERGS